MVLVPALERDVIVLHPLHELVRPGADREQLRILLLQRVLVYDLGRRGHHRQERPERAAQVEADLVRPRRLHALDRREEDTHRQLVLGVEQPGEREDDVLGRQRLAVVEHGVVDEVEEPRLVALLLPRLGQAGNELARLVDVHHLVVDVLVDLQRRVELGVARVHVHRLVDGRHSHDSAPLRLPLGRRRPDARPDEGAEPRAGREPTRPIEPLPSGDPIAHRPLLPTAPS